MEDRALRRTVRAYVGLGANIGDADATLADAVLSVAALPGIRLRGVSRLYASKPVGVVDQPEFRNAVVAIDAASGNDPEAAATELLVALKGLERASGRSAAGARWGPRELDLDILVFGRHRIAVERPAGTRTRARDRARSGSPSLLEIPHREARDRLFVLAPLADLAPGLVPPGWGETVGSARDRRRVIDGPGAVRPIATWDGATRQWRSSDAPDSHEVAR